MNAPPLNELEIAERERIVFELNRGEHHTKKGIVQLRCVSRALRISRDTLYRKIQGYRITVEDLVTCRLPSQAARVAALLLCFAACSCSRQPAQAPPPLPRLVAGPAVFPQSQPQAGAAASPRTNVLLVWDYPSNELAGLSGFNIYESTNLSTWTIRTSAPPVLSVALAVEPAAHYFRATAVSPIWGESLPSNPFALPMPPRIINTLAIQ